MTTVVNGWQPGYLPVASAYGKGIYQAMMNGRDLMDCIMGTELENFYLCPCSPDLAGIEAELYQADQREKRLITALEKGRRYFNYILIDCPPSLNLLTVNALVAAHAVLVPLQSEFFALEGLSQLMLTIREVRQTANPRLRIEGVVLTMSDRRNNLSQQVEADARANLGELVFRTVIPRNVRLSEAPSYAMSVLDYDPASSGSAAYRSLAAELIEREAAIRPEDAHV